MHHPLRRIAVLIAAIAAVAVIGVGSASAAGVMNAGTPSGFHGLNKDGTAFQYLRTVKASSLGGTSATKLYWGDPETTGGGTITLGATTTRGFDGYQTITVRATNAGQTLASALATISGGDFGSAKIVSTSLKAKTFTVKLMYPGNQGAMPKLVLKFWTYSTL